MTAPHAIRVENLGKQFAGVTAVDDVSFSVAPGELFGLIGPDGAGKTTTVRMLASIMDPTAGDAWVTGRHTVREAEKVKEDISYMSQRFGLYPDLTVQENIDFYADIYGIGKKERRERIDRLLAFSNLTPFRQRLAGKLSGGMKQKLGLACALIHTPAVLFLDEPTNGVDPVSRRDFWRILHQLLEEGVTIFVTTAYLDEADRCHRVGLIDKGRLLACDTPANLRKLMKSNILEIITTDSRKAVALLREKLTGESISLFGARIHVTTATPEPTASRISSLLREEGISLQSMREVEPNLEDVFVSVLSEERR
ncbi:MAG: multidrug ABC transporter ATP-binding protein [Nitrospirae bacterium GWC2_56_14]|nr:MAG: multidrug ABC transporter ATP-binding protein [Nitrospirae bacterium GWC2_56_14]